LSRGGSVYQVTGKEGQASELFALARRMGTSVEMIDRTYGHLAPDADAYEVELLDAWDGRNGRGMGAQLKEENQ